MSESLDATEAAVKIPPPESHAEHPGFKRGLFQLVTLSLVLVLAALSVAPLMRAFQPSHWGAVWVYICLGLIPAQGVLLAAWLAWGDWLFWHRFVVHWLIGMAVVAVFLAGAVSSNRHELTDLVPLAPLSAPLASLGLQIPLWAARILFGWRLERATESPFAFPDGKLTILHMMIGTVIAAIALACVRIPGGSQRADEYWAVWTVLFPSLVGASLVSALPLSYLLSRYESKWGVPLALIYAFVAASITIGIIGIVNRRPIDLWTSFGITISFLSAAAAFAVVSLAARNMGYRLRMRNVP